MSRRAQMMLHVLLPFPHIVSRDSIPQWRHRCDQHHVLRGYLHSDQYSPWQTPSQPTSWCGPCISRWNSFRLSIRPSLQVEMEAGFTNESHGWTRKGDAWGYRRHAYRKMAEILGGRYLGLYQDVFGREPMETRNIHQQFHPKPKQLATVA